MATIREVALLAKVSVATVSRVINESGYVKQETRAKIIEAMEQLHYAPSTLARGLAGKSMTTVALILPDITNPFFPELARAVEDTCQENGFTVIFANSDNQANKEKSYIEVLKNRNIDGIIFATNTLEKTDVLDLEKRKIPFVVLDRAPTKKSCSVVRSKNYQGAIMAVKHLLEVGCKKIAHIYGPQEILTAKERLKGYVDAVKTEPWYTQDLLIPGYFHMEGGIQAVELMLQRHGDVDGIFIGNDLMAVGALKALQRKGIRVPEQIAICGFDGIKLTEMTEPELSTVAQPIYELGRLSTQILIQKITGLPILKGLHSDKIYELDVTLRIRKSSLKEVECIEK